MVWPPPRSLATTCGISVDVFSSPYLDVSVQAVPHVRLFDSTHADRVLLCRVSPFGNPRINGHLHLPAAYRSLSRPSSAPDAKAFPLRPFQLDLSSELSPFRSLAPPLRTKPVSLGFHSAGDSGTVLAFSPTCQRKWFSQELCRLHRLLKL